MIYPRFTKVIIDYYLTRNPSLSRRNNINMHTARDDHKLRTLKFLSKSDKFQVYGALMPEAMTNAAMRESKAYKTYLAIASGAQPPKFKK